MTVHVYVNVSWKNRCLISVRFRIQWVFFRKVCYYGQTCKQMQNTNWILTCKLLMKFIVLNIIIEFYRSIYMYILRYLLFYILIIIPHFSLFLFIYKQCYSYHIISYLMFITMESVERLQQKIPVLLCWNLFWIKTDSQVSGERKQKTFSQRSKQYRGISSSTRC